MTSTTTEVKQLFQISKKQEIIILNEGLSTIKYYLPNLKQLIRYYPSTRPDYKTRGSQEAWALEILTNTSIAPELVRQVEVESGIFTLVEWIPGKTGNINNCIAAKQKLNLTIKKLNLNFSAFLKLPELLHQTLTTNYFRTILVKSENLPNDTVLKRLKLHHSFTHILDSFPPISTPTIIHGDLHPLNVIVSSNQTTLIDWEYASIGDRRFDLAYLFCYDFYRYNRTFDEYLNHANTKFKVNQFKVWIPIALAIMSAWFINRYIDGGRSFNIKLGVKYLNAGLSLDNFKNV